MTEESKSEWFSELGAKLREISPPPPAFVDAESFGISEKEVFEMLHWLLSADGNPVLDRTLSELVNSLGELTGTITNASPDERAEMVGKLRNLFNFSATGLVALPRLFNDMAFRQKLLDLIAEEPNKRHSKEWWTRFFALHDQYNGWLRYQASGARMTLKELTILLNELSGHDYSERHIRNVHRSYGGEM